MSKVLLADSVSAGCARILSDQGIEVDDRPGLKGDDLRSAVAPVEGLIVRSATKVDEALLDAAPDLKVIGRAGTGVDNIDVEAATLRGIVVMNAPGENTLSAAEHAVAMLMSLCRNVPAAHARMVAGEWNKKGLMGTELYGKTIGVFGLGRIGRAVAERARGFGMHVMACDPFLPKDVAANMNVAVVEWDELLAACDFITLHAPLTEKTRHLIDADAIAKCKKGVRIVNCARGGIVDEKALLAALETGQVAGAALDVFEIEPLPADDPIRKHPNVVLTPHLGASTVEAQDKVALRIAEQVADYLGSGAVRNAVNMPSVEASAATRLVPIQRLGECMGAMQAAMLKGKFESLEIQMSGEVLDLPVRAITASVLKGFLNSILSEPANLVNAEALARANGYPYTEVRSSETGDYASLIRVTVRTTEKTRVIDGTLLGHKLPRIVRIDDYVVDAEPKGDMLISANDDVPGILGAITGTIASGGVNIANMSLGRNRETGRALALVNLDSPLPPDLFDLIRQIDGLIWAETLSFPR